MHKQITDRYCNTHTHTLWREITLDNKSELAPVLLLKLYRRSSVAFVLCNSGGAEAQVAYWQLNVKN